MSFGSTDPLTSRKRFMSRTMENYAALSVIFVVLVSILSFAVASLDGGFLPMLAVTALGLGVVYFLHTLWAKRVIGFECNHCDRYIASNTPWVCPYCKQPNMNANEHPFVGECEHCGNGPKAYMCHYSDCKKLIFLSPDRDGANYAYSINAVPVSKPQPDERTIKANSHSDAKLAKQKEIELAELDEKLLSLKSRIEGPKIKTPLEKKKESFEQYFDGVRGAREIARRKKAEVEELYKDDPESLKDALAAIEEYLKRSA